MIRLLDIFIAVIGLIILFPLLILILILTWFDVSSPLFFQKRIGLNKKKFMLVKFRTMRVNTISMGTHLVNGSAITTIGSILRLTKLDELPQMWNVLKGDMSFVGPRPCLTNQKKLIKERHKHKIFTILPGITGLAQVKGINMSTPILLAKTDLKMMKQLNSLYYCYYIMLSILLMFGKKP